MLNINSNTKVIEEKIIFNDWVFLHPKVISHPFLKDYNLKSLIKRNLIDDTYDLEIAIYDNPYLDSSPNYGYANINNTHYFNQKILTKNDEFKIHRSELKDLKLKNTSVLVFGTDRLIKNQPKPYVQFILTPEFIYHPNFAFLNTKETLILKTIEQIEISLPKKAKDFNLFKETKPIRLKSQIDLKYNYLIIVPEILSQFEANQTLFKIYSLNETDNILKYDHSFSSGKLHSSSLKSNQKLTTSFIPASKPEKMIFDKNKEATFMGEVKINETTFYDYDSKQTLVGWNPDAIYGEVVPYNYHGYLQRQLTMDFNNSFKNFTIGLYQNIEQPLLDPDQGKFQLVVENNFDLKEKLVNFRKISWENLQIIKKRLGQKNSQIIPLKGLEQLSETF